ncbi:MAG: hypothetical protein ABFR32_08195 [Bacteroidota bacterium]
MKYLKIFVLLILVTSCNKKEIQLPKIGEKGITNIQNNSSIWMFFNVIENDTIAVLNKKNKISNTHLIFNIDKRLPLRQVMPKIHDIQEKLKGDSPHKSEGMRNYFNYADTLSNTYALFDFTNTNYIFTQEAYEKTISKIFKENNRNPILIQFDKESLTIDHEKSDNLSKKIETIAKNDSIKNRTIFLSFDQNLTYNKYLAVKTKLFEKGYKIENTEYIYSEE